MTHTALWQARHFLGVLQPLPTCYRVYCACTSGISKTSRHQTIWLKLLPQLSCERPENIRQKKPPIPPGQNSKAVERDTSREKKMYDKVRVTLMSKGCSPHLKRSQCVTFSHGPFNYTEERQSCSAAVTACQEDLSPEPDPEDVLHPARAITLQKNHTRLLTSLFSYRLQRSRGIL